MRRYLLAGCGYDRKRRIDPLATSGVDLRRDFSDGELFTLDYNARCEPDIAANLDMPIVDCGVTVWPVLAFSERARPLIVATKGWPHLASDLFDEVHAYEVLEHLGHQGEVRAFFESFEPFWYVLKAGGLLCATVPSIHSPWAWGDPGHRRLITAGTLAFLDRAHPIDPPSSDYRDFCRCDFKLRSHSDNGESLAFILEAIKPARWGFA